jgi:hypothetical protein
MSDIQNDNVKIQDEPNLTATETTKPKDDGSDTDPDPYCCLPKDPGGPDGTP